ncbi:MAG: hypothetical protein ACT4P2_06500 [Pseudomonadota bacterium]
MTLPEAVSIVEVGPRGGFQIESRSIPTATKIEAIDAPIALARPWSRKSAVAPCRVGR